MHMKRTATCTAMIVAAALATACGSAETAESESNEPTSAAAEAEAADAEAADAKAAAADEDTTLQVALTTYVGYGLWHLADEQGYFDDRGVEVELTRIEDKDQTAAAFASGRINAWITTVDTFLYYDAEKIGAVQVMVSDVSNGADGVIATDDIATMADLAGKTVGVQVGSIGYFFLLNALAEVGLTEDDIVVKDMGAGDAGAAFVAGHLDAASTWQPWLSQADERGHVLTDTADVPGLIVDTLAVSKETVASSPRTIAGVIAAYQDAHEFWSNNPDEATQIMADAFDLDVAEFEAQIDGVEFADLERNLAYFGTADDPGQIYDVVATGSEIYRSVGLVEQEIDPGAIIDPTFVQQLGAS